MTPTPREGHGTHNPRHVSHRQRHRRVTANSSAEIHINGSPFRYKFWFAWVQKDGEEELVLVEAAILQQFDEPREGQMVEALTSPVVTDFNDRWKALERTGGRRRDG